MWIHKTAVIIFLMNKDYYITVANICVIYIYIFPHIAGELSRLHEAAHTVRQI